MNENIEVLVLGGGPAGIAAAVAAARNGARTLLVERYGYLGGMISGAFITWFAGSHNQRGEQIVKGVFQELVDRLVKLGATDGRVVIGPGSPARIPSDPELFKFAAADLVAAAGVELLLHSFASGVTVENNRITGINVYNKSGMQTLAAGVFVDATGDADIAALAGVPCVKGNTGQLMPLSLNFKVGNVDVDRFEKWRLENPPQKGSIPLSPALAREPTIRKAGFLVTFYSAGMKARKEVVLGTMAIFQDGSSAAGITKAEVEARKLILPLLDFLIKEVPGFETAYLVAVAPQIGVRETRRIAGEFVLTFDDIKSGKRFADVIGRGANIVDIHENNRVVLIELESDFDIPYRCLIPPKIDNLLVAGRCISVERAVAGNIRSTVQCLVTGQAAGTAAALAVKQKLLPGQLDISALQQALLDQGVILYHDQATKTPGVKFEKTSILH